jgi:hypothetical protein
VALSDLGRLIEVASIHRDGTKELSTVILDPDIHDLILQFQGRILYNRLVRKYARVKWSDGTQVDVHVFAWSHKNGSRPPPGFVVHHRSRDKLDNRLANLELRPNSEHAKYHLRLRNWESRKFSPRRQEKLGSWYRHQPPSQVIVNPPLEKLPVPPVKRPITVKPERLRDLRLLLSSMLQELMNVVPQVTFLPRQLDRGWLAFDTYRLGLRRDLPPTLSTAQRAMVLLFVKHRGDIDAIANELGTDPLLVSAVRDEKAVKNALQEVVSGRSITIYIRPTNDRRRLHSMRSPPRPSRGVSGPPARCNRSTVDVAAVWNCAPAPESKAVVKKLRVSFAEAFSILRTFKQLEDHVELIGGKPLAEFMDTGKSPKAPRIVCVLVAELRHSARLHCTTVTDLLSAAAGQLGMRARELLSVPGRKLIE